MIALTDNDREKMEHIAKILEGRGCGNEADYIRDLAGKAEVSYSVVSQLVDGLATFGAHRPGCDRDRVSGIEFDKDGIGGKRVTELPPCTCGLDEAIRKYDRRLKRGKSSFREGGSEG